MSATHTLVVETSTPHASVALVAPDGRVESRYFSSDRNHNALLFDPLNELLENAGRPRIGLVLVGSGPGSYSGTRVGIAAAQGVAIACSCPAVAVPSILAVASAVGGAACMAVGDARRGSYWSAMMENHALTNGPELCDEKAFTALVEAVLGDGISMVSFEDPSRFPLAEQLIDHVHLEFPDAVRLWHVWQSATLEMRQLWSAAIPQPLYLKPPHITPGKRMSWMSE